MNWVFNFFELVYCFSQRVCNLFELNFNIMCFISKYVKISRSCIWLFHTWLYSFFCCFASHFVPFYVYAVRMNVILIFCLYKYILYMNTNYYFLLRLTSMPKGSENVLFNLFAFRTYAFTTKVHVMHYYFRCIKS